MKKPYNDLTGQRFGRLVVRSLVDDPVGTDVPTRWRCSCDCGNELLARASNLKSGITRSCGCLQKELAAAQHKRHGETGSRLFSIWVHMKQRCTNPNERAFKYYGARGIIVCQEWMNSFEVFRDWAVSHGYADNLTIDRIDANGNYCPENCRWITIQEQQRNKRDNVRITFNGQVKTVAEWAKEFGCYNSSVYREILKREGRLQSETYE